MVNWWKRDNKLGKENYCTESIRDTEKASS